MTLFQAFQATVAQHATQPALCEGGLCWTYEQALQDVQARAAGWAASPPGAAVLLNLPKSANLVLWQLAASAQGVAFAVLDPALPALRRAALARMTQARWQVTAPRGLPTGPGWRLHTRLSDSWVWHCDMALTYPADVSHIYFSSGSTGAPKAVLLSASPVVQVVRQQAQALRLSRGSRFGWLLQAGFDASLSDCYQTLLSGAALHIYSEGLAQRKTVQRFLHEQAITHTDIPPSLLPLLEPEKLSALEAVIFGGELAQPPAVARWRAAGKRMFNAYGPTEATICTSLKEVDAAWRNTNVGKPLAGVRYALQDALGLAMAAPGMRGELVILGDHLAIGYDRADLTAARFRNSPLGRGYWTGDAVAVDALGDVHFLGRIDRQLKRNGVLVCPEEIERTAYEVGCLEARLVVEQDRLILHYSGPVDDTVRDALQARLPPAFWPNQWVRWDTLPKTTTGKLAYDPTQSA